MRDRPDELEDTDLARVLDEGWQIGVVIMDYAPVGFGDHHWTATGEDGRRWFITVADLDHKTMLGPDPAAGLERALATALALAGRPGLEFVTAPVPAVDGRVTRPVGARYAISVFPWLEAEAGSFDRSRDEAERAAVIMLLARLHGVRPPAETPLQPIALTQRDVLAEVLAPRQARWPEAGPYTWRAQQLIMEHRTVLADRLAEFDAIAATLPTGADELVLTHGEPHPGNLLRGPDGLHLIDWDTVGLAVPERDLAGIGPTEADLDGYAAATGHPVDRRVIHGYHLRWDLEEIGLYAAEFRRPHRDGPDQETAWGGLAGSVSRLAGSDG
ncbi:aminoglycoside phosphotransferase family protein [Microlunatus parietis]|uniref:Spectinomycin phosphotransferase n=1 Tax=Microlunatus parietis TaxID=682979 RepID=A0A7Y9I207_9ACTN|nr:aminoglycoside phosphotransferase family protein [Microlunatus parietis]NYE68797.1 spectinomycin phosphotransferase [Microlunatus parietis]